MALSHFFGDNKLSVRLFCLARGQSRIDFMFGFLFGIHVFCDLVRQFLIFVQCIRHRALAEDTAI